MSVTLYESNYHFIIDLHHRRSCGFIEGRQEEGRRGGERGIGRKWGEKGRKLTPLMNIGYSVIASVGYESRINRKDQSPGGTERHYSDNQLDH